MSQKANQELIDALHEQDKIDQLNNDLKFDTKAEVVHTHTEYVDKTGDTMSGSLDMGTNKISNISDAMQVTDVPSLGQTTDMINDLRNETEASLQGKEPTLGLGSGGQVLATNAAADGKEWIDMSGGTMDHNTLTGRDAADTHPLDSITGLQDALDDKAASDHNHDADYVNVSGDTMTGTLNTKNIKLDTASTLGFQTYTGPGSGDEKEYCYMFYDQGGIPGVSTNPIYSLYASNQDDSGIWTGPLDYCVYSNDAYHLVWHGGNFDPTTKYNKSEHLDVSAGSGDSGKPIVLNSNGLVDVSMLETSTFYPVAPWDPSAGTEYPDTTGENPGAFWYVNEITVPDGSDAIGDYYEFKTIIQGGGSIQDLIGQKIHIGDFMVWAATGWGIMSGSMNPALYMKLDKSEHLDNNSQPLVVHGKVTYLDAGTTAGDAVEYQQWVDADAAQDTLLSNHMADTGNPHFVSTTQIGAVSKSGDTMTGGLIIHPAGATGGNIVFRTDDNTATSLVQFYNDAGQRVCFFGRTSGNGTDFYLDAELGTLNLNSTTGIKLDGEIPWTAGNFTPSDKEDSFGLGDPGEILATNAAGDDKEWITPPQGVTEHNLLTGRDVAGAHTIGSITDLQTTLDGKSDDGHTHTEYVDKTGDRMSGDLSMDYGSEFRIDDDSGGQMRYTSQGFIGSRPILYFQPAENDGSQCFFGASAQGSRDWSNIGFYTTGNFQVNDFDIYHSGMGGVGSGIDADMLQGFTPAALPVSTATQTALDAKANTGDSYIKGDHVVEGGDGSANSPVVTDANGKLSLTFMDLSVFVYQGSYTPVAGTEYPDDIANTSPGYFWDITGVDDINGYEFIEGDLAGQTGHNGDNIIAGEGRWLLRESEGVDPTIYYRLDGQSPISARFNGGNQQFKFAADGVDPTDLTTKQQLDTKANTSHDHVMADVTDLQPALDAKSDTSHNHDGSYVNTTGDTMTGTLYVKDIVEKSTISLLHSDETGNGRIRWEMDRGEGIKPITEFWNGSTNPENFGISFNYDVSGNNGCTFELRGIDHVAQLKQSDGSPFNVIDDVDIVVKSHLDTSLADKVSKSGDTMTGTLSFGDGINESNLEIRATDTEHARFRFRRQDATMASQFVFHNTNELLTMWVYDVDGSTPLTAFRIENNGNVSVDGTIPTANDHLTRKDYVDTGLSGKADAGHGHAITDVTDLQTELDSKADSSHNHNSSYVNLSGDTMTGPLNVGGASEGQIFIDSAADDTSVPKVRFQNNSKTKWADIEYNVDANALGLMLRDNTLSSLATQNSLTLYSSHITSQKNILVDELTPVEAGHLTRKDYVDGRSFAKTEHIDVSTGDTDGGKPIVLNSYGRIDMSMLETSSFYPVGEWDPSAGVEYPDTTNETPGAFWYITALVAPDGTDPVKGDYYEFKTSFASNGEIQDLVGRRIYVSDFMVWAATGWGIMAGEMNPTLYMKTNKSVHFDDNGSPLVVNGKVSFITAGSVAGEAVEYQQWLDKNTTQDSEISGHVGATDNPHLVTKTQVGLELVDNTADADKPISTATQTALDGKAESVHTHVRTDITDLQPALDMKVSSDTAPVAGSDKVSNMISLTQAEYDAITADLNTFYIIVG